VTETLATGDLHWPLAIYLCGNLTDGLETLQNNTHT